MLRLAQKAAKQLRGLRLVPPGAEEGHMTPVVVGQERRTLKVLLAIAAGAFLLQPEWLAASLQAGAWLPEQPFWAKVLHRRCPPFPVVELQAAGLTARGAAGCYLRMLQGCSPGIALSCAQSGGLLGCLAWQAALCPC